MVDVVALRAANAQRWANAKVTRNFTAIAHDLVMAKARYQAVEAKTGVPWFVIAVIHERESSQNWGRSLAQGDPWSHVSTHVPAGRGPFPSWEAAAIDALVNCGPYLARKKWRDAGEILTNLELYNGSGYASKGRPSPYDWAGTNQYVSGKYIADGVYDPSHVDTQPGCAGMILAMMALDATIKMDGVVVVPPIFPPIPVAIRDGAWLQTSLNRLGANPQLAVDGTVGPATRNAVRAFQMSMGLVVDGLVGPATFAALDKALAAGKPIPQLPVPPEIVLPPPGTQARADLAPTFWGRVLDLFRPKVK
jgi:lysozyme family protein